MSFLTDVRTRLINAGVAHATTYPCYVGYHPDTPDASMALFPSGGSPQDTQGGETVLGSFQVKLRMASRSDYEALLTKWDGAFDALQDAESSLSGVALIQALNSEPMIWYDAKDRPNASLNMRYRRTRT